MNRRVIIVSACLLGVKCRYDGTDSRSDELLEEFSGAILIPVCPEQLGGLPTPRREAEIKGENGEAVLNGSARVIDATGLDVTGNFTRGARETLQIARLLNAEAAILKEKSPSCGVSIIKSGTEDKKGMGVTTSLLFVEGLEVKGMG